ncbi:MAG: group II truncated hemoglobin [Methylobacillus sp.]|jgi:hemoglobin|nr:group II truncated hemoglobin [Methylobacillus sp.]
MQAVARSTRESFYVRVGGEEGIRRLVKVFYDLIETHPLGRPVLLLQLRGHGVAHARMDQFNFLSGFFGGPRLYAERYGHSDIRVIHDHVAIDREARDSWLGCMTMALGEVGYSPELKKELMDVFTAVADPLVNR